jgi:hypothetical protein
MRAVVTVTFGVCNSVRLSLLLVFRFCKCSINAITNLTQSLVTYHVTILSSCLVLLFRFPFTI